VIGLCEEPPAMRHRMANSGARHRGRALRCSIPRTAGRDSPAFPRAVTGLESPAAAIAAIAEAGLEIFEIAPRKVKQAVVGYGAAQKSAVAKMVQRLLNLSKPPAPDAADALALALAHAQENSRYNLTPLKRV